MRLSWLLGSVFSKILLSLVYFLFLTPIARLSKMFEEKDQLNIKNGGSSLFKEYNEQFEKNTFEKPW